MASGFFSLAKILCAELRKVRRQREAERTSLSAAGVPNSTSGRSPSWSLHKVKKSTCYTAVAFTRVLDASPILALSAVCVRPPTSEKGWHLVLGVSFQGYFPEIAPTLRASATF